MTRILYISVKPKIYKNGSFSICAITQLKTDDTKGQHLQS